MTNASDPSDLMHCELAVIQRVVIYPLYVVPDDNLITLFALPHRPVLDGFPFSNKLVGIAPRDDHRVDVSFR
jgi:hypothetical protein